jgi:[ribosomal protein S5]-alanine N-acetyltransferase
MQVLETARLRLRRLSGADAPFMLQLLNDPSFIRNIGDRGVRDVEGARGYLMAGAIASHEKHGYGLDLVELKSSGEAAGICGLVRRDYLGDPDIGFAFLPQFTGLGYAVESAAAAPARARGALALPRVLAIVSPGNERSIRVLTKIGLRYERMITPPGEGQAILLFTSDA